MSSRRSTDHQSSLSGESSLRRNLCNSVHECVGGGRGVMCVCVCVWGGGGHFDFHTIYGSVSCG